MGSGHAAVTHKKILQLERNNCPVGAENKGNNVSLHLKLRGKVAPCQDIKQAG